MHFPQFIKLKRGNNKLLLAVATSLVIVIAIMMTFVETPSEQPQPIWGEITIKEKQREKTKKDLSNYESIKQQRREVDKNTLRYKERQSAENPFFSFYKEKEKKTPDKPHRNTYPKPPKQTRVNQKAGEDKGFFSVANADTVREKQFFEAIFRESQQVQDGKALRIVLKDPIPALNLEENTILKGVPYLEGSTRLKIRITAAIVDDTVKPIFLQCFDKEDCMEGLYHDELSQQLEETTKSRLLEEALDLGIGEEEAMVRRGKNAVQKFSDLRKSSRNKIVIERGRELFVALPEKEDD